MVASVVIVVAVVGSKNDAQYVRLSMKKTIDSIGTIRTDLQPIGVASLGFVGDI